MGAYSPYRLRHYCRYYSELADGIVPPLTEEAEVPQTKRPALEAAPWEPAACLHADVDRALAHLGGPATSVAYTVLVGATVSRTALDAVLVKALKPLPLPRIVVEATLILGWDDRFVDRQWHLRPGTTRHTRHEALDAMATFLGEDRTGPPVQAATIHEAAKRVVAAALAEHDRQFGIVDNEAAKPLLRCG